MRHARREEGGRNDPSLPVRGLPGEAQGSRRRNGQAKSDGCGGARAGVVEKLFATKLVRSIADVFRLDEQRDQLLELEHMGQKSVDKLLAGIAAAKTRPLDRLLVGLPFPMSEPRWPPPSPNGSTPSMSFREHRPRSCARRASARWYPRPSRNGSSGTRISCGDFKRLVSIPWLCAPKPPPAAPSRAGLRHYGQAREAHARRDEGAHRPRRWPRRRGRLQDNQRSRRG